MAMSAGALAAALAANWPLTRAATAYDVDSTGFLNSFGAGVPLVGSEAGFYGDRIEAASTNVAQRSQSFDNAYWTKSSVAVSADTTVAPDGTTSADTLTDSDNTTSGRASKNLVVTDDSTYWAASVFILKTGSAPIYPVLRLVFSGGTPPTAAVVVLDTHSGATASSGAVAAGVQDCGQYWRLWVVTQNNSTGNTTLQVNVYPAGTNLFTASLVSAATGSNIMWGIQVENLPCMTSYIPTVSSSASRDASMTLRDVSRNLQQAFSICARMRVPVAPISNVYSPYLFSLNDGTASNAINVRIVGSSAKVRVEGVVGGVVQGNMSFTNTVTYPSEIHVAIRVRSSQIDACLNGGPVTPVWSGAVPNLAKLCWGRDITGLPMNFLNGLSRGVLLTPFDLNDNGLMAFGT